MGRKNRRRVEEPRELGPVTPGAVRESHPDGDWLVAQITGQRAVKEYRCPGCDHEIAVGMPHLVAWSADDPQGGEHRRHWHTNCWRRRVPSRRGY